LNKKPQNSKRSNLSKQKHYFYCFACKHSHPISELAKKGKRASGSTWALCKLCSDTYREERMLDQRAYQAAQNDWVRTDREGATEMGWNGVPSDRTLRRRPR
jgi:hypothetical protein